MLQHKIEMFVDNYQGEESDIVIASLTRSNADNDIGFMMAPERLNVLLSRARNGLILLGNSSTFMKSKKGGALWQEFFTRIQGHVYDGFPVKCERHSHRTAILSSEVQFERHCPDGGCAEPWYTLRLLITFWILLTNVPLTVGRPWTVGFTTALQNVINYMIIPRCDVRNSWP